MFKTMNRKKIWEKQGKYKSFNTGEPMILVMDKETGATILEPLKKPTKCKECFEIKDKNDERGECECERL